MDRTVMGPPPLEDVAPGSGVTPDGRGTEHQPGACMEPALPRHRIGPPSTMIYRLLVAALLVMGISHTVSRERLFEPLRRRLGGHDTWLGYLVCCPYCVSHWIAFAIVPLTGTYVVPIAVRWGI